MRNETGITPFEPELEESSENVSFELVLLNHQIIKVDHLMAIKYAQLPQAEDVLYQEPRRRMKIITQRHQAVNLLRGKYRTDSKREAPLGGFQVTAFKLKNGLAILRARHYEITTQTVDTPDGDKGLSVKVDSPVPFLSTVVDSGKHMRTIMQEFNAFHSNLGNGPITVYEG